MANHGPVYGLDAELKSRRDQSFDPKLEREALQWISSVTGEHLSGSIYESLKSGIVLCKLMNKLQPGKISKIGTGNMPFVQMENIGNYLSACKSLLASHDLFQTVDLYEAKNLNQVVQNILALKRKFSK